MLGQVSPARWIEAVDITKRSIDADEDDWLAAKSQAIYNSVRLLSEFLLLKEAAVKAGKIARNEPVPKKEFVKTLSVCALFGRYKGIYFAVPTSAELTALWALPVVSVLSENAKEAIKASKKRKTH